jgi:protein TonB
MVFARPTRHSRESGNLLFRGARPKKIPASAGMTVAGPIRARISHLYKDYSKGFSLYPDALPAGPFRHWEPKELGLPKAAAVSVLLVVAIVAFCLFASGVLPPPPPPPAIQVTQAQLVQLPAPTPPPPPPKVIPPPKPLPAIIPKPIPVPSKIVVATKPPPPVKRIYKPVPKPVVTHQPAPPVPVKTPTPPQPVAQPTSGLPIYGAQMHSILEANQDVPQALATLGISGVAYVEIVVAPDGHVISAKISRSSGNGLIDQTALQHAMEAHFSPFNAQMPTTPQAFVIPIDIQPQDQ